MIPGLVAAVFSALCYGVASVLQALGVRRDTEHGGGRAPLLIRVLGRWPFVAGIGLDLLAFLAQVTALRSLPLFVVQAAQAASLAVIAVVAVPVLGARLRGRERAAVVAVCAGLAMLGSAAGVEGPAHTGVEFHVAVLVAALVVGVLAAAASRLPGPARSAALGMAAGLGFGLVAVSARVITNLSPGELARDPAVYAMAFGGMVAFICYATALQRGGVTTASAMVVIMETIAPAVVGAMFLGDRTRHGMLPLGIAGFVIAVVGALALARFGDVEQPTADRALEDATTRSA